MNALLLSAGEGTRLRPLTLEMPKCLLPLINDEPILKYWIDILIEIGIEAIFINIYWLKDKIVRYIDNLDEDIRDKIYLYRENYLEPVGEVLSKLKFIIGSPIIIINSDTYIEKDEIRKFIQMAKITPDFVICLGIEKRESVRGKGLVRFDEVGRVTDFMEKPDKDEPGYSYAGIMLLDTSIITNGMVKKELTQDILPDFKNKMTAIKIGNVIDIGDSLETYYQACERFTKK